MRVILMLMGILGLGLWLGAWTPPGTSDTYTFMGTEIYKTALETNPLTRSQWLWDLESWPRDGAESYFRMTVDVPEPVESAFLRVTYDDSGELFLNGQESSPAALGRLLRRGRNVLAFRLKNVKGPSGLLFYGNIRLASGKVIALHSEPGVVKASKTPSKGWQTLEFDDSAWKPARSQGHVDCKPWSKYHDYLPNYTSPEERERNRRETSRKVELPPEVLASLAKEPDSVASVTYRNGMPFLRVNGKERLPFWHIYDLSGRKHVFRDNMVLHMSHLGVKIFELCVTYDGAHDEGGNLDFSGLDKDACRILSLVPDGLLVLRLKSDGAMTRWCKAHPKELIAYTEGEAKASTYGEDQVYGRPVRPSAASQVFRQEVRRFIEGLSRHLSTCPWRKRVIGFRPSYGIYNEWHTYGMFQGPDTGPAMTRAFRAYVARIYGSDRVLQQAWQDATVTLATAAVPTMVQRQTAGGFLLDPVNNRQALDYFEFNANVMAQLLIDMCGEFKRRYPQKICGAYYGYVFSGCTPIGANICLEKVLSSPYVDFLSNPMDYVPESRRGGGDGDHRTVPATYHRYGKLAILEDDSRFHQPYSLSRYHATATPRESQMIMRRNVCNAAFLGSGIEFLDPGLDGNRPHAFDDPSVLRGISEGLVVLRQIAGNEALNTWTNDTAVVVSGREKLRHDSLIHKNRMGTVLYRLTKQAIHRSGISSDLLTLEDFLARDRGYQVVVFLNLFSLTEKERDLIRQRVRQRGRTAIWLIAPGYVTECGFSDQAMSELTGMGLRGQGTNGVVACVDREARAVGPGVFVKTLQDGSRSMFSAYPIEDCHVWGKIFREAGSHAYVASGSYFQRRGDFLLLHTGMTGRYILRLPDGGQGLTELFTGKHYASDGVDLTSDGPMTWVFRINKKP